MQQEEQNKEMPTMHQKLFINFPTKKQNQRKLCCNVVSITVMKNVFAG